MKILIMGISGFVGTYLAEECLKNNHEVYGTYLHRKMDSTDKVILLKMNVTDYEDVRRVIELVKPDAIIHLIAQSSVKLSWDNPQLTYQVNVEGTLNVLEAVKNLGLSTRVLLVGSSEEYGIVSESKIPISEKEICYPKNPYGQSKLFQTNIGLMYAEAYGMDIVITRSFNHIGPNQSKQFVVSDFAKQIVTIKKGIGEKEIKVGNLAARRDFLDVRDIVRIYYLLLVKGVKGEIYNVGSGTSVCVGDLLNQLIHLSGVAINVVVDEQKLRPLDVPIVEADISKMQTLLGWKRQFELTQTLRDILDGMDE